MSKRVLGFVCSILGLIISIQIDNKFWIVFSAFFSGANFVALLCSLFEEKGDKNYDNN